MATSTTVNDLLELLEELRGEEDAILKAVEASLAEVRGRITAVQTTLDLISRTTIAESPPAADNAILTTPTPPPPPRVVSSQRWARELAGLSHLDALIKIAESGDGTIRSTEGKQILISAGLARGKAKNVLTHVYHLLAESDRFEKVGPGTFRLATPDSQVEKIHTFFDGNLIFSGGQQG